MASNCEIDLTIHGNLKRSFCQNLSSLDLNVLSVGLSTTSVGNEFQSLTTLWLNKFCLTPSRENVFILFRPWPLVFDSADIVKNWSESNLSMDLYAFQDLEDLYHISSPSAVF